jgi:aryl-alcohol dehydrogenase-like predicted oxidoreductase
MDKRRLGRTEHMSTVVTFGAAALGRVSQAEADRAVELALAHGVNHIDVAPSYGEAELRLGPWLAKHRHDFFLGCKTMERGKEGARAELHRSLERLQVDSFDLYQIHAVGDMVELDKALAPGGAIEAIVEAREQGLVRFIGITGHGHQAPAVHAEALRRFPFDTVLLPLNFVLWANEDYRRDFQTLLQLATEEDVGIMVIKALAKRPWDEREHVYNTWYEPFDDQPSIDRCVRFVLSQNITTLISSGDVRLIPMILQAAEHYRPLSAAEQAELVSTAPAFATIFA